MTHNTGLRMLGNIRVNLSDRSHTAGTVGGRASVEREQLLEILVELLDTRRLLASWAAT